MTKEQERHEASNQTAAGVILAHPERYTPVQVEWAKAWWQQHRAAQAQYEFALWRHED